MDNAELQKLLDEERKLSEFRLERWMNAEARLETIWNQAVDACRKKLGQHTPQCDAGDAMPCSLCWQNEKLTSLLRLDRSGYVTVKERIAAIQKEQLAAAEDIGVSCGITRMANAAMGLFGEKE